jgi:hypothetical protein
VDLLFDENLSVGVVTWANSTFNVNVIGALESGLAGKPDKEVRRFAIETGCGEANREDRHCISIVCQAFQRVNSHWAGCQIKASRRGRTGRGGKKREFRLKRADRILSQEPTEKTEKID